MFTMPYYQNEFAGQLYPYQHQFYHMNSISAYPVASTVSYLPFEASSKDPHVQEFAYFVVIDFEATCDRENNPNPQEIIEFPSVIVNSATGQLEGSFQTYVRPLFNQKLSKFCIELTGFQQSQVDRGVSLSKALIMHDEWLEAVGVKTKNFAIVTWTDWDCRVMLESECKIKKISKPSYFNRWINVKVPFREVFRVFPELHINLKEAVQLAGLAWEGRAHSGLDDARNTAHLLVRLIQVGYKLSITNSIVSESTDYVPQPEKPKAYFSISQHCCEPRQHEGYMLLLWGEEPCVCRFDARADARQTLLWMRELGHCRAPPPQLLCMGLYLIIISKVSRVGNEKGITG